MREPSENRHHPVETLAWLVAAIALLALRLPHLRGPLDDPHSWRQCDTVAYSLAFARRGIDLLHPSVCWLGAHRTLIFEFPLPEALSALLYRAFQPDVMWDRLVSLGFFAIATTYLHAIVRTVAGRRAAWIATLAYLALPLGQFYSRAAQVDFVATAGAHAMLYHGAQAFRRRSMPHAAGAAVAGTLGALVKGPYLLPVLGPLAVAWLAAPAAATLGMAAIAVGVPAVAFAWWRHHANVVNAAVPDWRFLPGFYKESDAAWWYFGEWAQRLDPAAWLKLARRLVREVATPLGALAMLPAFVPERRAPGRAPARAGARPRPASSTARELASEEAPPRPHALVFALAWLVATVAYLLVFFPLNVIHSYYQIPFLAPAAVLIGLGCDRAWTLLPRLGPLPLGVLVMLPVIGLAARSAGALGYYRVDELRVIAGSRVQAWVPPGDLIVASDPTATHSDPRLLQRADRDGWPVGIENLRPGLVDTLSALGARWLAVVSDRHYPELRRPPFLDSRLLYRETIVHAADTLGTLELFRLRGGTGIAEDTRLQPADAVPARDATPVRDATPARDSVPSREADTTSHSPEHAPHGRGAP